MIFVQNTPHNTGVAIYGDYQDFDNLYEALHNVVGSEEEADEFGPARIRVLAICYDLRHALMGDREIEFIDNGMDAEKRKRLSALAPEMNVYLKINALWTEMLFVVMALNAFIKRYGKKLSKARYDYDILTDSKVIWDKSIAQVRMLQAAVADCLRETLTDATYKRVIKMMNSRYIFVETFLTQYIDVLNARFLCMTSEKRRKNISLMAKRLVELDDEYYDLANSLKEEARKSFCSVHDLQLNLDYPEEIEW